MNPSPHPSRGPRASRPGWPPPGQLLGLVAGWGLLAAAGLWVLSTWALPPGLRFGLLVVALAAPLAVLGWVGYNVLLFLRKGPRREAGPAQPPPAQDFHGRRIEADWRALRRAGWIEVSAQGDVKRYGTEGLSP